MADHHEHGKPAAGGKHIQCSVVTPEATLLDAPADFVALPLFDGEIGIGPDHSPFIGRLGYGELRVVEGGQDGSTITSTADSCRWPIIWCRC